MKTAILSAPWVVGLTLASLVVTLGIGFWSYRRTRSTRDFFIAGQSVGLLATGLATMAAAFSGFVFLGGPGLTYRLGTASLAIVLPVGFTAGFSVGRWRDDCACWRRSGRSSPFPTRSPVDSIVP